MRELTAEAQRAPSKEILIKKYSELCDPCASVVKISIAALVAASPRWVFVVKIRKNNSQRGIDGAGSDH